MKRKQKKTGMQEILALDSNGNMESIEMDCSGGGGKVYGVSIGTYKGDLKILKNGNIISLVGYINFNYGINFGDYIEVTSPIISAPNRQLIFSSYLSHSNSTYDKKRVLFEVMATTGKTIKLKFISGFSTLPQHSTMAVNWSWII